MKKLNTNNAGRMPLWQADLDWLQDAFTEPITALVQELNGNRNFMPLTGCRVTKTDNSISMTSGWFWWDGEMLPVRELTSTGTTSFTNPVVHLEKVTYNDPDGARNFIHADLTSESVSDVWQDDYILPTVVERGGTFTSGVHILPGARTLFDEIKMRITDSESGWIQSTSGGMYYKKIGRMVLLKGAPERYSTLYPAGNYNGNYYTGEHYEPSNVGSGFPVPAGGGIATIVPAPANGIGLKIYIDSVGRLHCERIRITDDANLTEQTPPDLTGMMYMAAEPYESLPTDMNVVVCEQ